MRLIKNTTGTLFRIDEEVNSMQVKRMKSMKFRAGFGVVMPLALACVAGVALAAPSAVYAQDRGRDRGDEGRGDRGRDRGDVRDDKGRDRGNAREEVRRTRDEGRVRFTHSTEERRFDNGVALRRSAPIADHRFDAYFPHHYYSYPHYAVGRDAGRVVFSPFNFYVGIFPPYIDRSAVIIASPRRVFIDVPIYVHGDYRPYEGGRDDYYLNRGEDDRWRNDPDVKRAVYDMEDAFRNEDIALLAPLTDPSANISIFARGRYEYSLNPSDYLDMTRDFLRSAHTTGFTAYRVHPRAAGVYQVFARHTYQDQNGQSRTVYLCIVMERINERWTITQVDTSPSRV